MKASLKRGLMLGVSFILILLSLVFVSAEEGIKVSKSSLYLQVFILPIVFAIIAFLIVLIFLRGKLIGKPWLKGAIIGFIVGIVYSIIRYKSYLLLSYMGWLPIFFSIIAFMLIFITFSNLKNPIITFTKKGFWVGLTIGFIILYYAGHYSFTNLHRPDYKENIFYTLLFSLLALIIPTLIGFIAQKTKEKSDWKTWSYTKKGFLLGVISSTLILISWVIYILFEGRIFTYGLGYLFKDSMSNFILGSSIVLPVLLFTIIGWVIEKIKSQ